MRSTRACVMLCGERMQILVAEDNNLVRGALCGMLRVMSAAVVEAQLRQGDMIGRVFGTERSRLVVCDVFLPERSGVAVARTARAAGIATPFLFVSRASRPPTTSWPRSAIPRSCPSRSRCRISRTRSRTG